MFTSISDHYFSMTKAEKKVADYVMQHRTEVQYMSISELAEECGVADATISRFCRDLGLRGYNDFKLSLATAAAKPRSNAIPSDYAEGEITDDDCFSDMCQKIFSSNVTALTQSMQKLDEGRINAAADMLYRANRVYCMGQGGSLTIAQEACSLFSTVASQFYIIQDSHLQAAAVSLLTDQDAVLYFSYSGATRDMMDVVRLCRAQGTKVILVTRFAKSPGAAYADCILLCGANESPLQHGSVPARMAQLFVVDVLFNAFVRRDPEAAERNRACVANALVDKHL